MERKRISWLNADHQQYEADIEEYENHIVISRLLSTEVERVQIPERIHEKPVTGIGDGCFFECYNLKEVSIPGSIEFIGDQAFAFCKGITEIVLPDSVKKIGHHAFGDCCSLKKVVMSKGIKSLPVGIFSFCYLRDPEIILPEGLEEIEEGAFWSGGAFKLKIPDTVIKIGVGAFCFGPHPITKLPYDKGWFSQWPFGERVIVDNIEGKITDLRFLERACLEHEVTIGTEKKLFFYPCDYLDGKIQFKNRENQRTMENTIGIYWEEENSLSDTFKIREAWKRGLV